MENYSILIPSYSIGSDIYDKMNDYCPLYGKKVVVIGGKKALAAAKDKLEAAFAKGNLEPLDYVWYGTECTRETAARLEMLEAVQAADMIFAVGGGKAVDTCKLISIDLHKPYFSFPTIASNCAASSSLSIVYHEDGSFAEFVHFLESAKHVFIDTEIIAAAPKEYLWAGMGDTYAKYYEVSISARGEQLEYFKAMGVNMSRMCMETLVEHGEEALKSNIAGKPSYDLEQVALAIIITTGWVSMLVARDHTMDYNGGVAHAFYYGMCNLPGFDGPDYHLHGVVVGFGVLIALLIDGQEEECRRLIAFNKKVGLPTTLKDIDVTVEEVRKCAPAMTKDEDLEHYPYKVTADMIVDAAIRLQG